MGLCGFISGGLTGCLPGLLFPAGRLGVVAAWPCTARSFRASSSRGHMLMAAPAAARCWVGIFVCVFFFFFVASPVPKTPFLLGCIRRCATHQQTLNHFFANKNSGNSNYNKLFIFVFRHTYTPNTYTHTRTVSTAWRSYDI